MRTVRESVVNAFTEVTGRDRAQFADAVRLKDLGVDSMDLLEVGAIVEQEYGVELDVEDFTEMETLGDAIELFQRLLPR